MPFNEFNRVHLFYNLRAKLCNPYDNLITRAKSIMHFKLKLQTAGVNSQCYLNYTSVT